MWNMKKSVKSNRHNFSYSLLGKIDSKQDQTYEKSDALLQNGFLL